MPEDDDANSHIDRCTPGHRSNKHDASKIISTWLTRMLKIAGMCKRKEAEAQPQADTGDDDNDPIDSDDQLAGAGGAEDHSEDDADSAHNLVLATSALGARASHIRSSRGKKKTTAMFCEEDLPNGGQYRGAHCSNCCTSSL